MPWFDRFDALFVPRLPSCEVLREEPMDRHTTFRIGGPARRFVRPSGVSECGALLSLAEAEGWPVLVIGNGSNLLVSDEGLDALVIHTGRLEGVERTGERTIRAGAGLSLARLASFARREELSGLEFAHGIPGSLGGAVCMNAGAYGGEMKQVLSAVTAWFPGEGIQRLEPEALALGYRHSVFSERRGVVLEAELSLEPGEGCGIAARGPFCRGAHCAVRPERRPGRRGPGVGEARGLCHQRRGSLLRRCPGLDRSYTGDRVPADGCASGTGSQNRPVRAFQRRIGERKWKF